MTMKSDYCEIILEYRVSVNSTEIEYDSRREEEPGSPDIVSRIQEQLAKFDPNLEIRYDSRVISEPRVGLGYDGLLPGLVIRYVIIPATAAAASVMVPLIKAWLKYLEGRRVVIKRRDGQVIEFRAEGFGTEEILRFLEASEDEPRKKDSKQEVMFHSNSRTKRWQKER